MLKLAVLALFVASVSAGVVSPVERCPAQGLPLQLRVTDCEGAPPCNIVPDTNILVEGDFIPSADSANAKFKLVAETSMGDILVTEAEIGPISGGVQYTAGQTIRISDRLSGEPIVAVLSVFDVATERVEICVKAAMNIL